MVHFSEAVAMDEFVSGMSVSEATGVESDSLQSSSLPSTQVNLTCMPTSLSPLSCALGMLTLMGSQALTAESSARIGSRTLRKSAAGTVTAKTGTDPRALVSPMDTSP